MSDVASTRRFQEDRLLSQIAEVTGIDARELASHKRLFHDLGIYGDDAVELFTKVGEAEGVDWSEMPLREYFPVEAPFFFFNNLRKSYRAQFKPLTVDRFLECVRAGKWITDDHAYQ